MSLSYTSYLFNIGFNIFFPNGLCRYCPSSSSRWLNLYCGGFNVIHIVGTHWSGFGRFCSLLKWKKSFCIDEQNPKYLMLRIQTIFISYIWQIFSDSRWFNILHFIIPLIWWKVKVEYIFFVSQEELSEKVNMKNFF